MVATSDPRPLQYFGLYVIIKLQPTKGNIHCEPHRNVDSMDTFGNPYSNPKSRCLLYNSISAAASTKHEPLHRNQLSQVGKPEETP